MPKPMNQSQVTTDGLLTEGDLLYIESVLLQPVQEELQLRKIFRVNGTYPRFAREVGYDVYKRKGEAAVVAAGGRSKDTPFVGDDIERVTQPAVDIEIGVEYTKDDLEAAQARRALGKGPAFSLDQSRVENARRYVAEKEDQIGLNGSKPHKVDGLLTKDGVQLQNVADVSAQDSDAFLEILHASKVAIEGSGHFKSRTLMLTPADYLAMLKPLTTNGTVSTLTLYEWFKQNGLFFENIITTNALRAANNVHGRDLFVVCDSSPQVGELIVVKDIELGPPDTDWKGVTRMLVSERFGGISLKYPEAVYIGKQPA